MGRRVAAACPFTGGDHPAADLPEPTATAGGAGASPPDPPRLGSGGALAEAPPVPRQTVPGAVNGYAAAIIALLLSACPAEGPGYPQVNGVYQISPADLAEWISTGSQPVHLVDGRVAVEYRRGHLPGAISIPGAALVDPLTGDPIDGGRALTDAIPNRDDRVLFYCAGSECNVSQTLAEAALMLGYADVWRLEGGTPAWEEAGLPFALGIADFCTVPYYPLAPGAELVDVRDAASFAAGTIPGAISVPADSFLDAAGRPIDGGRAFTAAVSSTADPDYILGHSTEGAARVAWFAVASGYRAMRILEGGYADWLATTCAAP